MNEEEKKKKEGKAKKSGVDAENGFDGVRARGVVGYGVYGILRAIKSRGPWFSSFFSAFWLFLFLCLGHRSAVELLRCVFAVETNAGGTCHRHFYFTVLFSSLLLLESASPAVPAYCCYL